MYRWSQLTGRLLCGIAEAQFARIPVVPLEQCYLHSDPKIWAQAKHEEREVPVSATMLSLGVYDNESAKKFIERLLPGERALFYDIIKRKRAEQYMTLEAMETAEVHHEDLVNIWWMNFVPFLGYGFLDNCLMIVVGESVDRTIGLYVGISIMAAAALGNMASNVFGIGLVHYVEVILNRFFNLRLPQLSIKQLNNWSVGIISNSAKVCGLLCGCVLGMFPLLFYDSPERVPPPRSLDAEESEASNTILEQKESDGAMESDGVARIHSVARKLNSGIFTEYEQFLMPDLPKHDEEVLDDM